MGEVIVSVSLTKRQQGELYMRSIKLEKQVRELTAKLNSAQAEIRALESKLLEREVQS